MTSMYATQTIENTLLDRLDELSKMDQAPTEFVLRNLEREADKLAKVDAASASIVKAGIAALRWDDEKVQYWVENALRLNPSVKMYTNAGVAYRSINSMTNAINIQRIALTLYPLDRDTINRTLLTLILNGLINEALLIAKNKSEYVNDGIKKLISNANTTNKLTAFEENLKFQISSVFKVLTKNKKRICGYGEYEIETEKDPDSGNESTLFSIYFFGTLEEEMEMDMQLAEILIDHAEWNPNLLSVELRCRKRDANQS